MQLWVATSLAVLAFTCGAFAEGDSSQALSSESAESLESTSPDSARLALARSNNAFGIELYKTLRNESANLVMSPLSAASAMTLVWMGCGGETARQLASAMRLPEDRQHVAMGYKGLLGSLRSSDGVNISFANKLFIQENFVVKDAFRRTAVEYFGSDTQQVNFESASETARQTINQWAEEATGGKIKDLFKPDTLDTRAVMVLANAIYFKGEWLKSFKENETREEPFYLSAQPNSTIQVPMMNGVFQTGFKRLPKLDCTIMELPYKGSTMRMLVLLPNQVDGLSQLEDKLTQINFNELTLYPVELKVKFPKFKILTELSLKEKLQKLQVLDLFEQRANLTQLSDAPNIQVSKVLQKAFVEVNEKGTEASVVTAVEFFSRSGRIERDFHVNHPFLFVIQGADGNIIFMGRVNNPSLI